MSIITEALKKAEKGRGSRKEYTRILEQLEEPRQKKIPKGRFVLLLACLVITIIAAFFASLSGMFNFMRSTPGEVAKSRQDSSIMDTVISEPPFPAGERVSAAAPAVAPEQTNLPPVSDAREVIRAPQQLPVLSLNGIMYTTAEPLAIIDNRTVAKGDTIRGAVVTAIERDNVQLDYNGETIVLNLR